jgi:hypothetical protein
MHTSVYENMSRAEHEVCAHLRELGLWWHYEQPVFVYDHMERPRVWTPDFYVPELGIYIEVMGDRQMGNYSFREKIYRLNRIPIIFLDIQHTDWRGQLGEGIETIHQARWHKIRHGLKDGVKDAPAL